MGIIINSQWYEDKIFVNYLLKTFTNELVGINPMGLSAPKSEYLEIISLQPVKKLIGINPMGLRDSWADYLDIIDLNPV